MHAYAILWLITNAQESNANENVYNVVALHRCQYLE